MIQELKTFVKAQFSAFTGYVCDYSIMLLLKEIMGVYYLTAMAISGIIGAIVNFLLNKKWTFRPHGTYKFSSTQQVWRFIVVVLLGLFIKIIGTNILTIVTHIDYKLTRLAMDAIVFVCVNYTLQRVWVFKHRGEPSEQVRP
jgi:putative flippase GtrA